MTDVPELLALKYENGVLKLQQMMLRHQQMQAEADAIQAQQTTLLVEMRAATEAGPDDSYNVQTRKFTPAPSRPDVAQSGPTPVRVPRRVAR